MKIILIGASGQLGRHLIKSCPKNVDLFCPTKNEIDLSQTKRCFEYIIKVSPDWVINSAAYTNVEKAETDQEMAFKINALGPQMIAKALSKSGGKLLQISTDYVFSGSQNHPYEVSQSISPINFYGISKAKGEEFAQKLLKGTNQLCIIRTSWLMSPFGSNFATKMIKLLNEREEVKVVYDQISSPTTTLSLTEAIWKTVFLNEEYSRIRKIFPKINHFSNSGIASWYDVAVMIEEISLKLGLLKKAAKIIPIRSDQFQSVAKRPRYSVLDANKTKNIIGIKNNHWRSELFRAFDDLDPSEISTFKN